METTAPDFTVIIPARMASTRLPGKPLADIAGTPMIVRVAERALQSGAHAVVVAADDTRIMDVCVAHGIRAILTDAHHLSGSDRLAQACSILQLSADALVVNVQGDEPFIPPALIRALALTLHQHPSASMASAACPIHAADIQSPHVVKVVMNHAGYALYFSRSPLPYPRNAELAATHPAWRHIGIYAYRAGFIQTFSQLPPAPLEEIESLEQLRALSYGHSIIMHTIGTEPPAGVDTSEDLLRAQSFAQSLGRG